MYIDITEHTCILKLNCHGDSIVRKMWLWRGCIYCTHLTWRITVRRFTIQLIYRPRHIQGSLCCVKYMEHKGDFYEISKSFCNFINVSMW